MNYTIRKAVRDFGVTILGVGLLFVSTHVVPVGPDVGLDQSVSAVIAAASLAAYRGVRDRNPELFELDRQGA